MSFCSDSSSELFLYNCLNFHCVFFPANTFRKFLPNFGMLVKEFRLIEFLEFTKYFRGINNIWTGLNNVVETTIFSHWNVATNIKLLEIWLKCTFFENLHFRDYRLRPFRIICIFGTFWLSSEKKQETGNFSAIKTSKQKVWKFWLTTYKSMPIFAKYISIIFQLSSSFIDRYISVRPRDQTFTI